MKFTSLGQTGLTVSKLCLGTMLFGKKVSKSECFEILDLAHDSGLIFWDTSDIYGREGSVINWKKTSGRSEKIIGEWFESRQSREDIILCSKVRWPTKFSINQQGLSRRYMKIAIEKSLDNLKTTWIDLYLAHGDDKSIRVNEIISTFSNFIEENKIHNYGLSNFQNYRIMKYLMTALMNSEHIPSVVQYPYSLAKREVVEGELSNLIHEENLGTMMYAPLDGGFLAAKYGKEDLEIAQKEERKAAKRLKDYRNNKQMWEILDELKSIAHELDVKASQVAQAWTLSKEHTDTIVVGVSNKEQLVDAIGSLDVHLDSDHIKRLDEVSQIDSIPWWVDLYNFREPNWIETKVDEHLEKGKSLVELLF